MPATFEFRVIGTEQTLPYSTRSYTKTAMVPTTVKQPLWDSANERISISELSSLGLEVLVTPEPTPAEQEYDHYTMVMGMNPQLVIRVGEYKAYLDNLPALTHEHTLTANVNNEQYALQVTDYNGVYPIIGMGVSGEGIPEGSKVSNFTKNTIVLDNQATADVTGTTITLSGIHYKATTNQIRDAIEALALSETEKLEMVANINAAFQDVKVNYQAIAAATSYAFPVDDFVTWNGLDKLVYYSPNNAPYEPDRRTPFIWTQGMDEGTEEPPYPID